LKTSALADLTTDWQKAHLICRFDNSFERKLLRGSYFGDDAMKSRGPERVCFVLALLAFLIIAYILTPPAVLKQATALFGFDWPLSGRRRA
jgi:hypothetical protein